MSAERTVTSSSGQPRQAERHRTGSLVVAPRGAPVGRAGRRSGRPSPHRRRALPLLAADALAALTATLLLPGPLRSPALMALLLAGVLALNLQGQLYEDTLAPSLLTELPALGGRIALAWCATAVLTPAATPALTPALAPDLALAPELVPTVPPLTPLSLSPATLLSAVALHGVLGAGGRALVHWHRRSVVRRRPRPVLVLGHGGQARSVATALLRRPRCGLRPVGVVGEATDGEQGPGAGRGPAATGTGVGTGGAGSAGGASPDAGAGMAPVTGAGVAGGAGTPSGTGAGMVPGTGAGTGAGTVPGTGAGTTIGTTIDTAPDEEQQAGAMPGLPLLADDDELNRAVIQNDVRTVLLLADRAPDHESRLTTLRALGCELWEIDPRGPTAPTPRAPTRPLYVAGFRCHPLVSTHRPRPSVGKRALDAAVSGTLLLLTGPLLLTCALVLRVTEGPGVIFRQERVGKDGRLFTLLKFRTHRPADPQESATRWSVADEHRISPFCRFLRSTSLDELPQLWNVLRGDMSLVGPRPERPFFVDRFSRRYPHYAHRHRMPTGVTGLAQVHGLRGDTSIEDRCRFDNAYIDSWSLWQDLCILLRTIGCLLRRTGS
ncbi:sugar transferase [Streptomyces aureocirculatus]|uniref:sugar transferase n=1 Tax=Streptomyces aureocirculatus TaxID=67275 RepID=UPI00068BA54C|nr:sugar transferase [Streptomyces aureocirculatus]